MKNRLTAWRKPLGMAAAAALGLGSLALATAPAAQAATVSGLSTNYVGVPQQITVSGFTPFCTLTTTLTFNGSQIGLPTSGQNVVTDSNGNASLIWTPQAKGNVSQLSVSGVTQDGVTLCGTPIIQSLNVNINAVPTTTTVNAPNTAVVGQATKIEVIVQSSSPSAYAPTGNITIVNANGAAVSPQMGLTAGPGNGQSYAYYWWTPTAAGTYYFKAQYGGDGNAAGSTMSPLDTVIATPSGSTISISAPPQLTQGQSVTLTATVYPAGTQGSVGFTINGNPISAAIPINANGQASFTWTPNISGVVTLGASYTTNAGGSGSTSEQITINAGPAQQDAITLVQPGWGPWAPNGTYTLGNGSNFTFQASSLSGAAVTLSETGPCAVSGLTITVPVGSGVCNLKASTNGGNGYAPVTYGYTVNLIPGVQTATLSAPVSGRYKVGRVLVLESPAQQDTNAGQNISWKVKKGGKAVCKLLYPNDGSVTLRIAKKGSCTVIGSAPGVPGQWQAFQTARNYTGR